ncbi:mCG1049005, partial [Mus musculus]
RSLCAGTPTVSSSRTPWHMPIIPTRGKAEAEESVRGPGQSGLGRGKPGTRTPGQSRNSSSHLSFAESRALNPSAITVLHSISNKHSFQQRFSCHDFFL